MTHLWEIEHPYTPWAQGMHDGHDWQTFKDAFSDADEDYNVVFRWDWEEDDEGPDDDTRAGILTIVWVGARKGNTWMNLVPVTRADEPEVLEFLQKKAAYVASLWHPILVKPA